MKAVVVYESMYGNTHRVADAIGRGLARRADDVTVVPIAGADLELIRGADVLVVGGPTHVRGMTRPSTRKAAVEQAKPGDEIDPAASGPGVREWLEQAGSLGMPAAAFDTRADVAPAAITGRASKGIAKQLSRHECRQVVEPESFLVDKTNRLEPGEEERAEGWGAVLAAAVVASQG
jgi:hypothetical protein